VARSAPREAWFKKPVFGAKVVFWPRIRRFPAADGDFSWEIADFPPANVVFHASDDDSNASVGVFRRAKGVFHVSVVVCNASVGDFHVSVVVSNVSVGVFHASDVELNAWNDDFRPSVVIFLLRVLVGKLFFRLQQVVRLAGMVSARL
jgi:hypothetical protein